MASLPSPRTGGVRPPVLILILALVSVSAPILAAALVPVLLGGGTAAAITPVERIVCALAADGRSRLIVAGDSRAKMQVDPALLEAETGLASLNVAEVQPLGGDLATLVRVLGKYPAVLESRPILILSLSVAGLDDLSFGDATPAVMLEWALRDHLRAARQRPAAWSRWLYQRWLRVVYKAARLALAGETFSCADGVRLPAYLRESRGYLPDTGTFGASPLPPKSYPGGIHDGAAWREFRKSLA